uniref:NADH-ubiquinone oxidoreductase chain 3 n=1 Tax=Endecameris sp. ZJUH 20220006 TaxID=2943471 RepID=A0A9E8G7B1_9HYME|nr:NADH dehydrogenase subunit 3 [Endecameris sp. ZJUH 20220006]
MINLILLNLLILLISSLILLINMIISKKMLYNRNKISAFECGFDNLSSLRLPFSIQFFLISIIFLIFDIEIALIFPIIKTSSLMLMKFFFIIIIMILILGLYYEWKEGSLNWLH